MMAPRWNGQFEIHKDGPVDSWLSSDFFRDSFLFQKARGF